MATKAGKVKKPGKVLSTLILPESNEISQANGKKDNKSKSKRKKSLDSPGEKANGQIEKRLAVSDTEGKPIMGDVSGNDSDSGAPGASTTPKSSKNSTDKGQSPVLKGRSEQLSIETILNPIMNRLDSIDGKLKSLTSIEKQLTKINSKITSLDTRLTGNETAVKTLQRTVSDLEESRNFDAAIVESVKKATETNAQNISKHNLEQTSANVKLTNDLKHVHDTLQNTMANITSENIQLKEEIVDLKARSMRDNLLFFNFAEQKTHRKTESCINKIYDFCEWELNMQNVRENVKIDRAHRIGPYKPNKVRPIVAKFNFYQDKELIKRKAAEKLQNSKLGVGDQFPKEIQQRRRTLIPVMKTAQRNGHTAILSYDKLYVDGKLYDPDDQRSVELVNRRAEQRGNQNRSVGENRDGAFRNGSPNRASGSASAQRSPNGSSWADQGARPKTGVANGAQNNDTASGFRADFSGSRASRTSKSSDVD